MSFSWRQLKRLTLSFYMIHTSVQKMSENRTIANAGGIHKLPTRSTALYTKTRPLAPCDLLRIILLISRCMSNTSRHQKKTSRSHEKSSWAVPSTDGQRYRLWQIISVCLWLSFNPGISVLLTLKITHVSWRDIGKYIFRVFFNVLPHKRST